MDRLVDYTYALVIDVRFSRLANNLAKYCLHGPNHSDAPATVHSSSVVCFRSCQCSSLLPVFDNERDD